MAAAPLIVKAAPGGARPKRPGNDDYRKLQDDALADILDLTKRLLDGRLAPREWYDRFANLIAERHAEAWALGRRLTGDSSDVDEDDLLVGRAKADEESTWLLDFLDAVESGRYLDDEGKYRENLILNRSRLYAGKLRGTANEAFVETSDDGEEFDWVLGAVEEHCAECPELAALSPWLKDEFPTFPGSGGTPCLTRCRCHLVRSSDGLSGFAPVPF